MTFDPNPQISQDPVPHMMSTSSSMSTSLQSAFCYDVAVVCGVPGSLPANALRQGGHESPLVVDLQTAREQHAKYVEVLRELVSEVVVLPPEERYPDCVFVEDPVVVQDGVALITLPGHESRRGETVGMSTVLEKLGLDIVEMTDPARMDGGDVLFTGREFLVGISERTNREGLSQLAKAFPKYEVLPITVQYGLHLKSFMSMIGPDMIGIGMSQGAKEAKEQICNCSKFIGEYTFVDFPDDAAANCLYIDGNLVHTTKEVFPNSSEIFDRLEVRGRKYPLDVSELGKVDGCLTCSSVLIRLKT